MRGIYTNIIMSASHRIGVNAFVRGGHGPLNNGSYGLQYMYVKWGLYEPMPPTHTIILHVGKKCVSRDLLNVTFISHVFFFFFFPPDHCVENPSPPCVPAKICHSHSSISIFTIKTSSGLMPSSSLMKRVIFT